MNTLNGSKLHLARKTDSRYAVCRRTPINGAASIGDFEMLISNGYPTENVCKNCMKRFQDMTGENK